ncbi:uncharacterized protein EI90DRAFT_3057413 [Cantharellus anzutake]|uniref:uncharacterized protein n=1 Tax=Cantharellus anzutake TaxID=1750568 RepID=UPI001908E061|nr:uncharacterized protein EI90DRAFT_3057413 [Cantharellus anzutake]KAF8331290.1 hypothetical protein EI90DRAFT_3057413 [Cantharellus anzutake]
MSLPPRYDVGSVCNFPFDIPQIRIKNKGAAAVYTAGAIFAIANWFFLDAAILSAHTKPPRDAPYDLVIHVSFVDWIPGICSIIGLLIVNLVNKANLRGEETSFSGSETNLVWRARLFLFMGFAFLAGGLAGSVTVLVLKYILSYYPEYQYFGIANVVQNAGIMLSGVVLWWSALLGGDDDYPLPL